jgi:hypothetical protein
MDSKYNGFVGFSSSISEVPCARFLIFLNLSKQFNNYEKTITFYTSDRYNCRSSSNDCIQ